MRCYKVCLISTDPHSPMSSDTEQAVWVVEVRPVQAIVSTITVIVINFMRSASSSLEASGHHRRLLTMMIRGL